MEKSKLLKEIIINYENSSISIETAISEINKIATIHLDAYSLDNYWKSESLDNFINRLLASPIENWKEINDKEAIILIKEIVENLGNDALIEKNTSALEKRYSKTSGVLSDWIFIDGVTDTNILLEKLKKDDVIKL
ncbi:conserved protein of unknown function [Tenacibaculum sp. 190524A02b]|uniref:hypothetical protein n=1 Tax=Tenacibaculum vairaonense TaxID=3137860 RepID=UPI0032B298F4